jgi:hypothetical protein
MGTRYSIAGGNIKTKTGFDEKGLLDFVRENFSKETADKVKQWNDMFDGRNVLEVYIDKENDFAVTSYI